MSDKYVERIKSASTGVIYTIRDQDTSTKQDLLVSGENIKTINHMSILGSGNIDIQGGGGTSDYEQLSNLPAIDGNELHNTSTAVGLGLATTSQLNAKADKATTLAGYGITDATSSSDFLDHVLDNSVHVTSQDKATWSGKQDRLSSVNAGANITITEESGVVKINSVGSGGTADYAALINKPQINSTELSGDKSASDLGLLAGNQGSENAGKFLKVDVDGSVVPASGSTTDDALTTDSLEDLDDALEFTDEDGNIALKVTNEGKLQTVAFDSDKMLDGYERFYPLTFLGYWNASGTAVTTDANDYLYTQIFVEDIQGELIFLNCDPNETYCMFKNASGQPMTSWTNNIKSIRVPYNAHSLCLSNYLYGSALDFYIVRPKRKNPIPKGYINYLDFTRPTELVMNDIGGGQIKGTCTAGTGLVLNNGYSNMVVANKVVLLNTFAFGVDIVLPEPTATESGGVTTYTYAGSVALGSDPTGVGYGGGHASCILFDFANKTITMYADGNGHNTTGSAIKTGSIVNAFEDGCRNFQLRIERKDGDITAVITCTDSGKSDSITNAVSGSTAYNSAGNLYDRPHFYSNTGSTVFKNFWVSARNNPQCVMCGDSITQGSRNPRANVWSYKFQNYLGNGAVSAGRGSGSLPSAMNSIATLASTIKPKCIIVAIGTNGTAVPSDKQRYAYMKKICDYYGIVFIACCPWACSGRKQCDTRAGYIRELNFQYADLNRLTKAGFKDSGEQVLGYFNEDKCHLSESGNTLTYNYFVSKFGWIKDI